MTGLAAQVDNAQDVVGDAIHEIMRDTMLSRRGAAKVLGISHGSLIRWIEGTNTPLPWAAASVMHRIRILRDADTQHGLFRRVSVMSHKERIDTLQAVIANYAAAE